MLTKEGNFAASLQGKRHNWNELEPSLYQKKSPDKGGTSASHGQWCDHCHQHFLRIENNKDRTGEWLDATGAWLKLIGEVVLEGTIALVKNLAIGLVTLFVMIVWLIESFCTGAQEDARRYEAELSEKDDLNSSTRDALNRIHQALLLERQGLLKGIGQVENTLSFHAGHWQVNRKQEEDRLAAFRDALHQTEQQLDDVEAMLKTHKHA